jgi:CheY-like chemotaxis protein
LASSSQPDLVCVDLVLPEVSGLIVCAHVWSTPVLADSLVLVVNSRHLPENKARAERAGVHGYLSKPFTVDDFGAHMRQVVESTPSRK